VAKTLHGRAPENLNGFRHELASLVDLNFDPGFHPDFVAVPGDRRELLEHLLAAHHGRGRPHFPADEATDPERAAARSAAVVRATPGRYARLQRQYGRWGLAYLESLVRAADVLDSRRIDATPLPDEPPAGSWPRPRPAFTPPPAPALPTPTIRVAVDPTNPGQFFACCGLLELAGRLWPGAEGWFAETGREFHLAAGGTLRELLQTVVGASLTLVGPVDAAGKRDIYSGPGHLAGAFNLALDWWLDHGYHDTDPARGSRLKPWAGTMESVGIARAMQKALAGPEAADELFEYTLVVPNADDPKKKKEPFYFDSRRGANALPLDVGFVQDALGIQTLAHPAVEFFAWVGLQRCRPLPTDTPRVFDYFTWTVPCGPAVLPPAMCGLLGDPGSCRYRFENAFRTGQKKHKAFTPATPLGDAR
jgi:hypothetical protein